VLLLVVGGFSDQKRMRRWLMGRAAPNPYGLQLAAAHQGSPEGEPNRRRPRGRPTDTYYDAAVLPFPCSVHCRGRPRPGSTREPSLKG
jgi:hypothetical protein